jgi:hypothetical protein
MTNHHWTCSETRDDSPATVLAGLEISPPEPERRTEYGEGRAVARVSDRHI